MIPCAKPDMVKIGRARPLQLLCGTGEPRQSRHLPGTSDWASAANTSPPQPETPDLLGAYPCLGRPMVASTASAPSLPRGSLCRHSSAIRTGCANQRPSGSARGAVSDDCPYRDRIDRVACVSACLRKLFTLLSDQQVSQRIVRSIPFGNVPLCLHVSTGSRSCGMYRLGLGSRDSMPVRMKIEVPRRSDGSKFYGRWLLHQCAGHPSLLQHGPSPGFRICCGE